MGDEAPLLNETVQSLSRMIKDLEKQLERTLAINEALERDLGREKQATLRVEQERNRLEERVDQFEREVATIEDLRAEIGHLGHERARLAATIEELGKQLAETEQENRKLDLRAERLRAERDDAHEELESVELQFGRAMEIVDDLRSRVATFAEERESLIGRLKTLETQLKLTEDQRDALKHEVEESSRALDEIRRQIAEACAVSQDYYQQPGALDE